MDIFSIFRSSPEKQVQKLRKKVKEPHGDASVRQNAAQRLYEMGTPLAIRALLDRFTINVSPSIQDEQEKQEVLTWLLHLGEDSVPPIISYLKRERLVYWPAKALKNILDAEQQAEKFTEILRYQWENPPATAFPKADLIRAVQGIHSQELSGMIRRFLEDEDDDVRLAAIEFLLEEPEEEAREHILECYVASEDRPRIRNQILDLLAEKGWTVKGFRPTVEESLPDGYDLTREGKIRKVGF